MHVRFCNHILQAFTNPGSPDWESMLLPEEEEDDRDFLLDPDALLVEDEEGLPPSLSASHLQTRYGG